MVFEYGIRYFPNKKGIHLLQYSRKLDAMRHLFKKACKKHGHEKLVTVIEETLLHCRSDGVGPYNVVDA